jgi:hypothetical protein
MPIDRVPEQQLWLRQLDERLRRLRLLREYVAGLSIADSRLLALERRSPHVGQDCLDEVIAELEGMPSPALTPDGLDELVTVYADAYYEESDGDEEGEDLRIRLPFVLPPADAETEVE